MKIMHVLNLNAKTPGSIGECLLQERGVLLAT